MVCLGKEEKKKSEKNYYSLDLKRKKKNPPIKLDQILFWSGEVKNK